MWLSILESNETSHRGEDRGDGKPLATAITAKANMSSFPNHMRK